MGRRPTGVFKRAGRLLTAGDFSRTWAQTVSPNGRKTSLGLGSYPVVTLAMAREKALANAPSRKPHEPSSWQFPCRH